MKFFWSAKAERVLLRRYTMYAQPEAQHLRVNSRLQRHAQPSCTHTCECSRAPKKSTRAKIRTLNMLKDAGGS